MIAWSKQFPRYKMPLGYLRTILARHRFQLRAKPAWRVWRPGVKSVPGYCQKLEALRGKYAGRRCFLMGTGPSLKKMDLSFLKEEITIASNGFYTLFPALGFKTTFLLFEDVAQIEKRYRDFERLRGLTKLSALHNAYAFKADRETIFMNVRWGDQGYWQRGPQFSFDFPHIVFLGATITYIGLQLAYHLGCNPIYLIGIDHNYGDLPKLLPPGKFLLTEENIALLNNCHFSTDYWKVGEIASVPYLDYQNRAYGVARSALESKGVKVLNAGIDSHLEVFPKVNYLDLFEASKPRTKD